MAEQPMIQTIQTGKTVKTAGVKKPGFRAVEVGAAGAGGAGLPSEDEVFLTPRVIDQDTFGKYGEALRRMIREATAGGEELASRAEAARQAAEATGDAVKKLGPKIEMGARLLATLDDRAVKVEALLGRIGDAEAHRSRIEAGVEGAVRRLVEEGAARAERALGGLSGRAAEAEARAAGVESRVAGALVALEARAAELGARGAAEAEARAAGVESRVAGALVALEARAAELEARASAAEARAAAAKTAADAAMAEAAGRVATLSKKAAEIEARCQRALERAGTAPGVLSAQLGRSLEMIEARARAIAEGAGPLASLCDRAEGLLASIEGGTAERAIRAAGALSEELARSRGDADAMMEAYRSLTEQAGEARSILASAVMESVEKIDALDRQRAELVGAIEGAMGRVAEETPEILGAIDRLRAMVGEVAEAQRAQAGALGAQLAQIERSGAWLAGLIARAEGLMGPGRA